MNNRLALTSFTEVPAFVTSNLDGWTSFSKLILSTIDVFRKAMQDFLPAAVEVAEKFEGPLKGASEVIGVGGICKTMHDFADGKKRTELKNVPLRLASRVTLAAGQVFECINFLNKIDVISAGALVSTTVGNLPVLGLVKNSLFLVSSGFSAADNAKTIKEASQIAKVYTDKKLAWENTNIQDVEKKLKEKYDFKKIEGHEGDFINEKVNRKEAKMKNAEMKKNKALFGLVADIAKIAIIALSSIAAIFCFASPVGLFLIAALGLLAASIGFAKTLAGEYWYKEGVVVPEVGFRAAPAA